MIRTSFKLELPVSKSYVNDNGYYHIAFSISTTSRDSYGHVMTAEALDGMLSQAKSIMVNANHEHGLGDIIGPVTDAWIEKIDDISYLWVDVRVRREWETVIKDLIDSGVSLGGSIEGEITSSTHKLDGEYLIDDITLFGAALTTIPANNATLGTAATVNNGCPGSLCMQLKKFLKEENLEVNKLQEIEETAKKKENVEIEDKNSLYKLLEKIMEKTEHICNRINPEEEINSVKEKTDSENVNKALKMEKNSLELEKAILELKTENIALKNTLTKDKQNKLIKKALKLNKKLDPHTQIISKRKLMDELKSFSNGEGDVYLQLESYTKGLELALKKIPVGDIPKVSLDAHKLKKDGLQGKVLEKTRLINEMGKEA